MLTEKGVHVVAVPQVLAGDLALVHGASVRSEPAKLPVTGRSESREIDEEAAANRAETVAMVEELSNATLMEGALVSVSDQSLFEGMPEWVPYAAAGVAGVLVIAVASGGSSSSGSAPQPLDPDPVDPDPVDPDPVVPDTIDLNALTLVNGVGSVEGATGRVDTATVTIDIVDGLAVALLAGEQTGVINVTGFDAAEGDRITFIVTGTGDVDDFESLFEIVGPVPDSFDNVTRFNFFDESGAALSFTLVTEGAYNVAVGAADPVFQIFDVA